MGRLDMKETNFEVVFVSFSSKIPRMMAIPSDIPTNPAARHAWIQGTLSSLSQLYENAYLMEDGVPIVKYSVESRNPKIVFQDLP